MRISHVLFALILIGWGTLGFVYGDFAPGWQPVPESLPAHPVLANLTSLICVIAGVGLLWRETAALAIRVLFFWLLAWLLLLRIPWVVVAPQVGTWWPASSTAIVLGSVWVLYSSLAKDRFITGDLGLRVARTLFGVGLIPIGLAHFLYLEATAPLVPGWLGFPVFWAYFTGAAFIAAGLAAITGFLARLAALLVTLQFGLLTVLVWLPRIAAGTMSSFQWGEFFVSIILTGAAFVVADTYRDSSWLGMAGTNVEEKTA